MAVKLKPRPTCGSVNVRRLGGSVMCMQSQPFRAGVLVFSTHPGGACCENIYNHKCDIFIVKSQFFSTYYYYLPTVTVSVSDKHNPEICMQCSVKEAKC